MKIRQLVKNRTAIFLHDMAWVPISWLGAYWLRFNLDVIPDNFRTNALMMLPMIMVAQGIIFWILGLYRGIWRFASMPDLVRILKAVISGMFVALFLVFLATRGNDIPRSVFPLYALILLMGAGGSRFLYRWYKDRVFYGEAGKRVLIVGAGRAAEMLVRDLKRDGSHTYHAVALVDDDINKIGKEIYGVRVLGTTKDITLLIDEHDISIVLIALPSATSQQVRRIVGEVEHTGVQFRILPKMEDLMSGQVSIRELKEVAIEDLLGREQAVLDWQRIQQSLTGNTILVTGGGGSIGSELCRQIANLQPARLIILEHSEYNLYLIEQEIKEIYSQFELVCVLGDCGDSVLVNKLFSVYRPQLVFHAAAYKHVPMLEGQVRAAITNNVLATRTVVDAANKYRSEIFVLVSTDKAVNPANIMGSTKRIAEIYCQTLARSSRTKYITVRFGNVLGSAGSVIPLFQKQIEKGGPVTVTHKDITRYFMTIPEASQLILQAAVMGSGGEIYVLDMGDPVKINYLAEQLILLSGKRPQEDIEIVYTGLRPGEKLYEELFHKEEKLTGTVHPKILLADSRLIDPDCLNDLMTQINEACDRYDDASLVNMIKSLVPESGLKKLEQQGDEDLTMSDKIYSIKTLNKEKH